MPEGVLKTSYETVSGLPECRFAVALAAGAPGTSAGANRQYPGWPQTIRQQDNYGRRLTAYLPTIEVSGATNPVIQVIDESSGEIVYTLRISGSSYRPKVFRDGRYTIRVGQQEAGQGKSISGVRALPPNKSQTLKIAL